jgi:hypothetical protein
LNANDAVEQEPLYAAETLAKGRFRLVTWLGTNNVKIAWLGGKPLVEALREIASREAKATALVKQQSANLWAQLVESASNANPLSRWHLPQWIIGCPRARQFRNLALQVAARLNAVGRDGNGSFIFGDFDMRAGTMAVEEARRLGLKTGGRFQVSNPLTNEPETLTIGPVTNAPQVGDSHQLLRPVDGTTQAAIYQHYRQTYPEMIWFLDMFIDPRLAGTRQKINGVEVPIFNRFGLSRLTTRDQHENSTLTALTPDILLTRTLLAAPGGFLSFRAGADHQDTTGASREAGHVLDLLSGFTVTAWRLINQRSRREWIQAVMQAAIPVKCNIVPPGWVDLESGMEDFCKTVKRLHGWSGAEFLERNCCATETSTPAYHAHFGEFALPNTKALMVPKALIPALARQYAKQPTMLLKTPIFGKSLLCSPAMEFTNRGLVFAKLIAVSLLLGTLWRQPYDYFTLLRWVVCGVSACTAFSASDRGARGWRWVFAVVALAFNPILPLHLTRTTWAVVDLAAAALLLASIFALDCRRYR